MNTITITVTDDEHVKPLAEMLNSLDFVGSVDVYEEADDEFTPEEIQLVEERLEHYAKNPDSAKSWEQVRETIKQKYGF